nr:hypothetical protein [Tanacetum cinerariifolium]
MEKEEEEIIKSINETPAQKAAKRRRLRKQAKEDENLKKQLDVVADEDDDVFVEATPIGTKVPVVNYENMFEKTDAQDVIWRSQQTEHGQALVKSWKLLTLCGVHIITFTTTMFVLLVEKKYPFSRPKENTKCVSAAGEELTAAKHKLKLLELKLFRDAAAAAHMNEDISAARQKLMLLVTAVKVLLLNEEILSSAKPTQDISHATRPMAPIIEDCVSDSEDESEPNDP